MPRDGVNTGEVIVRSLESGYSHVNSTQEQAVLNSLPSVRDSAVVGLPDEHCLAGPHLADVERPRLPAFVPELPRTATGKKVHYRLRSDVVRAASAGELLPAPRRS